MRGFREDRLSNQAHQCPLSRVKGKFNCSNHIWSLLICFSSLVLFYRGMANLNCSNHICFSSLIVLIIFEVFLFLTVMGLIEVWQTIIASQENPTKRCPLKIGKETVLKSPRKCLFAQAGGRMAVPRCMINHAWPCAAPATAARSCLVVHGRTILQLASFGSPRLCRTSVLPWNCS